MSFRRPAISAARKSRKTRTRAEWRRSGWVRSHKSAAKRGSGGERRTSEGRTSATKQGRWPTPTPASTASASPKRKAKAARYKNRLPAAVDPEGNNLPAGSTGHWWAGLSPLPADKSDVVVIGEVRDAQAFLSEDNTGVYSEFNISVSEVLKDDPANPLTGTVVGERAGGAIRLPNGRTKSFRPNAMGFPRVGRQYVLFLQRNPDGQDYTILTGYELRGGRVFALDGNKKSRFAAYDGADEAAFLSDVRNAVARGAQTSRK